MPAATIVKGKNLRIKIDDNTVYHATECNFNTDLELESIATKDTDGNVGTPGNYSWGLDTSALVAVKATGSSQNDTFRIIEKYQLKETVAAEFTSDVAGDIIITGNCYITSIQIAAPVNGSATYSVTMVGDGDFTLDRIAS